jgi:hypothetical protein
MTTVCTFGGAAQDPKHVQRKLLVGYGYMGELASIRRVIVLRHERVQALFGK